MLGTVRGLSKFLSFIVIVISAADALITVSAPWWLKAAYERGYGELGVFFGSVYDKAHPSGSYYFMVCFIIFCGIFIFGILFEAYRILNRIKKENPFCRENSKSFQYAGLEAFIIAFAFLVKLVFSPSILTLFCMGVFILFAFFMVVLSELFKTAAQIKEENELTI